MSIRITTDVFCDGCGMWAHFCVAAKPKVSRARAAAKADGWTATTKMITCPDCNGTEPGYWLDYKRDPERKYLLQIPR